MTVAHPLLAPYQPTDSDPFDVVKAAHLLNRAGFGGTPEEIDHVRSIGPQAAVDELLDFPDAPVEEESETDAPDLSAISGLPSNFRDLRQQLNSASIEEKRRLRQKFNQANQQVTVAMTGWWLHRMAHGPYPLQEKLTLFWHGHFTSSAKDERLSALMWRQNELLRRYAAANFGEMTHAISRDPAMLDYLNNTQNRREHPNENYARELMELFTLGIGNYTETDVKQGARAFTGWTHDGEEFVFHKSEHDFGVKQYLGHIGNFNGDDVVEIILQQPVCAPFIASELYRYLVADQCEAQMRTALGLILRDNGYELRPLLRTLLTSRAFYNKDVIGAQIKCPVQLMVGAARLLDASLPPPQNAMQSLTQMGQVPFQPPNVRGWLGGRTWINTSTMFVRYNVGVMLTNNASPKSPEDGSSAEQTVDYWVARLIQRPIDAAQRAVLIDALDDQPDQPRAVQRMVQLIVSMPEFQLC